MVLINMKTLYPLYNVHDEMECVGRSCVIHRPSDHPLNTAPLDWDRSLRRMSRVCPHDYLHPDPDDLWYAVTFADKDEATYAVHACDGCCDYVLPKDVWAKVGTVENNEQAEDVVSTLKLHRTDWLLNSKDGTLWVKRGEFLHG